MADGKRTYNWIAIRTAFVVKGYTYQQCADEFGLDVTTIKKRGSKEGWAEERHRNATQGAEVAGEAMRAAVEGTLVSHAARAQRALSLSDKLTAKLELAIDAVPTGDLRALRSVTETYLRFTEALGKGFASDRLVRALHDNTPSDGDAKDVDNAIEFTVDEEALEEARRLVG